MKLQTRNMTLEELTDLTTSGAHVTLEVHALGPMLYVAFRTDDGQRAPLRTAAGETLSFPSLYAAQTALREAGVTQATLVHRSAYGEMIGMDTEGQETELREALILTQD